MRERRERYYDFSYCLEEASEHLTEEQRDRFEDWDVPNTVEWDKFTIFEVDFLDTDMKPMLTVVIVQNKKDGSCVYTTELDTISL